MPLASLHPQLRRIQLQLKTKGKRKKDAMDAERLFLIASAHFNL